MHDVNGTILITLHHKVVTFLIDIFWLVGFYTWIKYTMATLLVSAAPSIKVYLRSLVINTVSIPSLGVQSSNNVLLS